MKKLWITRLRNQLKKMWLILLGVLVLGAVLAGVLTVQQAANGDTVSINYTLKFDDGTVYYSSKGREPLKAVLGEGMLIAGFEKAVKGMRVGDSKTVRIPFEQAYGQYRPELVAVVSRSDLPEGVQPVVGQQLRTTAKDGTTRVLTITEVTQTSVTFDGNSPLAGLNLTFDIELVAIEANRAQKGQGVYLGVLLALSAAAGGFAFITLRNRRRFHTVRN